MAIPAPKPDALAPPSATTWLPPSSPLPLYSQSSQYRNWRYSKEGLARVRTELNVKAVGRVKSMVEEERQQQSTSAPLVSSTIEGTAPPPPAEIQYLTVDDELSLVTYYLTQVAALCGAFKFPEMVEATAQTYLKRFYLRNTCMDYHPKNVMLTCVFLATKTENHPISIDSFAAKLKTQPSDILGIEFLVSQSLRFEYKVHHAHLALWGVGLDLQQSTSTPPETILPVYTAAQKLLRLSRLTDAEFIFTPSQIALSCFALVDPNLVAAWLEAKEVLRNQESALERGELGMDELIGTLEDVKEVVRGGQKGVDKAAVTEVDRRLKWARNPEKDPSSALYQKRLQEQEAEREAKAQAKAAKHPPPQDFSNFFS